MSECAQNASDAAHCFYLLGFDRAVIVIPNTCALPDVLAAVFDFTPAGTAR